MRFWEKAVFMQFRSHKRISWHGALVMLIIFSTSARADMIVTDLRARPSLGAAHNSIVWMTLRNTAATPDRLLRAEGDVAERVELHTHVMEKRDGRVVMRMRPVPDIPVPAEGEVRLEPGGLHVMLIGVRRMLRPGDRFRLRLVFEHASAREIEVPVLKLSETMGGRMHVRAPASKSGN